MKYLVFEIREAMLQSLDGVGTIDGIVKLDGDNEWAARYNETWYTAAFNLYTGMHYVDDKHGKLPDEIANELEEAYQAFASKFDHER